MFVECSKSLTHFGVDGPCAGQPFSGPSLPLAPTFSTAPASWLPSWPLSGHPGSGPKPSASNHLAMINPTSALNIDKASWLVIHFFLAHYVRFLCGHSGFHKAKGRALLPSHGCLPNSLFHATTTGRCRPFAGSGHRLLFNHTAAGSRPFQTTITWQACNLGGLTGCCSAADTDAARGFIFFCYRQLFCATFIHSSWKAHLLCIFSTCCSTFCR